MQLDNLEVKPGNEGDDKKLGWILERANVRMPLVVEDYEGVLAQAKASATMVASSSFVMRRADEYIGTLEVKAPEAFGEGPKKDDGS